MILSWWRKYFFSFFIFILTRNMLLFFSIISQTNVEQWYFILSSLLVSHDQNRFSNHRLINFLNSISSKITPHILLELLVQSRVMIAPLMVKPPLIDQRKILLRPHWSHLGFAQPHTNNLIQSLLSTDPTATQHI